MNLEEIGIPFTQLGDQKEIDLFWYISQSLVSKSYLNEVLQLIVTMTAEVMKSKICSLMLFDEKKGELAIAASQALSSEYLNKANLKIGESVSGRAVKEGRPIMVADVTEDKTYRFPEIARKEGLVSLLSVPMRLKERIVGVINSYTTAPHVFTETEVKLLQAVANQAAVAIENTKLREENIAMKKEFEERKVVDQAKVMLMERENIKETDALKLIENASREQHLPTSEVAAAILLFYSIRKEGPSK